MGPIHPTRPFPERAPGLFLPLGRTGRPVLPDQGAPVDINVYHEVLIDWPCRKAMDSRDARVVISFRSNLRGWEEWRPIHPGSRPLSGEDSGQRTLLPT